jgi:hypothetical protein
LKSTDRGRSWRSIAGDIPERHLMWRIVQDHENPNLLFTATEFALMFSLDGGQKWTRLSGDAPTIGFRDVTIQRREDDLVAATFGRGFYIVDDISPLRSLSEADLNREAMLFPGRKAWWYVEQPTLAFSPGGSQGNGYFRAENPPFGANFTYYLAEDIQSLEEMRQEREKPANEAMRDTPFPGFDAMTAEILEQDPVVYLTVRDSDGNVVRRLKGPAKKGFHRVNWNLRYPDTGPANPLQPGQDEPNGYLAAPGQYTVSLSKRVRGQTTELVGPQPFMVERLRDGALPAQPDTQAFWQDVAAFDRKVTAVAQSLDEVEKKIEFLDIAVARTPGGDPTTLDNRLSAIRGEAQTLDAMLNGNQARSAIYERTQPTVRSRLGFVMFGTSRSTYGPTQNHRDQLSYAKAEFDAVRDRLRTLREQTIPAFEAELEAAGAPWVPGAAIPQ